MFKIAKTAGGYASTATILVSIAGSDGSLIADANGDLFGTTKFGGATANGTVFEIAKTAGGYASTPTTLVSFNVSDGDQPEAGLIADSDGDLFGTTARGGGGKSGTVFEIAKTAGGYASAPTTLVSFDTADGDFPTGSLIADARGDLFGTTEAGANADGTVFEIVKTPAGYASTPTTLVIFNGADGNSPDGSLIADANGDLFGTTENGGANDDGTVFEIRKTAAGYASAPTTLVSFDGADGANPVASLIADANGDLFGTTADGGAYGDFGTVFKITNSGFATTQTVTGPAAPSDFNDDGFSDILWQNASGQAAIWEMNGTSVSGCALVGGNPGPSWKEIGTGDFNGDGFADILWQNTSGQAAIWEMNGTSVSGSAMVGGNPGASWKDRNGRLQRRRQVRHPVAERQRPGRDLGDERDERQRQRIGRRQSRPELARDRHRRFQRRRQVRHPVAERQWPGGDLVDGRDQSHRRRIGRRQSGPELEGDRNGRLQRRRQRRHPVAERQWPGRDLEDERDQRHRRHSGRRQSRARAGRRSEHATSTATASPTSSGRTPAARRPSGR